MRALVRTVWRVVRADLVWTIGVVMGGLSVAFFTIAIGAGIDAAQLLKGLIL